MRLVAALLAVLSLSACNQNSSLGNDREAQVETASTPAPAMGAAAALDNVATAALKPETMSGADIAALGGLAGKCAVRFTEVAHPSFVYDAGGSGAIKLNGKLITLSGSGEGRFADAGLAVTIEPNGERGDAGLEGVDLVVVPPGAKNELGYSGFVDCRDGEAP